MSFVRIRALVVLTFAALVGAFVILANGGPTSPTVGPGYRYVCVGGTATDGRPLPVVCVPVPDGLSGPEQETD